MRIQAYKLFTRIWSAYCKTMLKDVGERGKAVICPVFGIFAKRKCLTSDGLEIVEDSSTEGEKMTYMPSKQLMTSDYLTYEPKQPWNLKYLSTELLKTSMMYKPGMLERINMSSISKLVEVPEATVVYILK